LLENFKVFNRELELQKKQVQTQKRHTREKLIVFNDEHLRDLAGPEQKTFLHSDQKAYQKVAILFTKVSKQKDELSILTKMSCCCEYRKNKHELTNAVCSLYSKSLAELQYWSNAKPAHQCL